MFILPVQCRVAGLTMRLAVMVPLLDTGTSVEAAALRTHRGLYPTRAYWWYVFTGIIVGFCFGRRGPRGSATAHSRLSSSIT
jgi:hypothetical protein